MLVKPQMQELKNKFKDILMQKFMPSQEVHYLLHSPVNMIDKLSKQSPIIHMLKVLGSCILGTTICNIFYPTTDCIKITNGSFTIYLNYGEVKIYVPK
jgi:hypothetical protein